MGDATVEMVDAVQRCGEATEADVAEKSGPDGRRKAISSAGAGGRATFELCMARGAGGGASTTGSAKAVVAGVMVDIMADVEE